MIYGKQGYFLGEDIQDFLDKFEKIYLQIDKFMIL